MKRSVSLDQEGSRRGDPDSIAVRSVGLEQLGEERFADEALDRTFEPWSGADLMQDVRTHADAFGMAFLDEALERLNQIRGD